MIEMTRLLINWSKNANLFQAIKCAQIQSSITAHLDTINDIQISPK